MAKINIFALGGQDENGKNCYVVKVDKDIFIVDAGIKIPVETKLGIDKIIPTFSYIEKNINNIKGIFISHGHDEAFAALPWLLMSSRGLTIYASEFSTLVIKRRILKYKIGHNDYNIVNLNKKIKIGDVFIKPIELAHSIPGTLGFNFQTADGDIIYMSNYVVGDLGEYGKTDLNKIKSSVSKKGLLALLLETSRSPYVGSSFSKSSVKPVISKTFKNTSINNRIIVGAYDEEMYTLKEVLDLALETNRPVIPYGRAYYELIEQYKELYPKANMPKIINYKLIKETKNVVILVTGTGERLYQRFIRIAEDNDVFLKFKSNDTVIMIAPPINGHEKAAARTLDLISRNLRCIYDVQEQDYYKFNPANDDIKQTLKILKPKHFLPITGLHRYMSVAKRIAEKVYKFTRTSILQNGTIICFKNGKFVSDNGQIKDCGDTIIDGFGVGDLSYGVISEREELARDGIVIISMLIDHKTKKPLSESIFKTVGVMFPESNIKIFDQIKSKIIQTINEQDKFDYRLIQNRIRNRIKKLLLKTINKEPMVVVTFYDI